MAKAYWITVYRSTNDAAKLAEYVELAGPALTAAGGRFLARGMPAAVYEVGHKERTVILEFASVAEAIAAYGSPAYREALTALGDGAEREVRIIEGCSE
jgi:uncharacterized protein (DUF1330 family)